MSQSLFDLDKPQGKTQGKGAKRPLADQLRPKEISEVVGQAHLLGDKGILHNWLENGAITSLVFWGPPGCGKTTLAKLLAERSGYRFKAISAVSHGAADLKKIFEEADHYLKQGKNTLLLVDEIHRFNRAQQDLFLPHIENGTIILIGATTENPSFELNAALLSRCKVLVFHRLEKSELEQILQRAEKHSGKKLSLDNEARETLLAMADGDGRYLLNMCEELFALPKNKKLSADDLMTILQKRAPRYDKHQEEHYNLISALHKSLRGSDADAALYWLNRMLDGGEDPLYITRRLVRFAVEDIGLADPQALQQALAAKDTYHFLGSPEGELAIAQAVIYLATAPKSNAGYVAYNDSLRAAKKYSSLNPPKHILNAPTKLMKDIGYSKGYEYDHNSSEGFSGQNYFPEEMQSEKFYNPVERGFEREVKKRLEYWEKLRNRKKEG